jgi:hypothetical protein
MLASLLVTSGIPKHTLAHPVQSVLFIYDKETVGTTSFFEGLREGFSGPIESKKITELQSCQEGGIVIIVGAASGDYYVKKCGNGNIYVADTAYNINMFVKKYGASFCSIEVNQSTLLQIKSIQRHIPEITRIGYLYSSNSEISDFEHSSQSLRVKIVSVKVPVGESPGSYFRHLINDVDAILVSDNEEIWPKRNIKGYLLASIRQGKNLIGGSGEEYVKAGILAGIYTDMRAYGQRVGVSLLGKRNSLKECAISPPPGIFKYNKMLATRMSIEVYNE